MINLTKNIDKNNKYDQQYSGKLMRIVTSPLGSLLHEKYTDGTFIFTHGNYINYTVYNYGKLILSYCVYLYMEKMNYKVYKLLKNYS